MKKGYLFLVLTVLAVGLSAQNMHYTADDLYGLALQNSSRLFEKTAREKAARYKVRETRSQGAPTLDFESNLSYISNPDTLTVEAGSFGTDPFSMPSTDTVFEMSGNTYYDFKLIVNQPLFTWGKIHNAIAASKEGAAAASLDSMKMRERLKTEILINYQTLHFLKEIELTLGKQVEIVNRLEIISEDSYNNGMILQTEFLETRAKADEAEMMKDRIGIQIEQLVLNLTYLSGIELTPLMIVTEDISVSTPGSWQEIIGKTVENNRDLAILRHNITSEEYKSKIQNGSYYFKPDLALHMELSYSGSRFPFIQEGWNDENRGNMTLTVAIRSPIADFGALNSAARGAEEQLSAAKASYETARDDTEKFIRKTLYEIDMNQLNINYYRQRIDIDQQIITQKEKEWKSGYGDEKEFLLGKINYFSNVVLFNQEMINLNTNNFRLLNIMGN